MRGVSSVSVELEPALAVVHLTPPSLVKRTSALPSPKWDTQQLPSASSTVPEGSIAAPATEDHICDRNCYITRTRRWLTELGRKTGRVDEKHLPVLSNNHGTISSLKRSLTQSLDSSGMAHLPGKLLKVCVCLIPGRQLLDREHH